MQLNESSIEKIDIKEFMGASNFYSGNEDAIIVEQIS